MKKKILIADDHSIIRIGLNLIIKENYPQFEILEASSVEKAIEILSTHSVDLVILDIDFPQKSGLVVLKFARTNNPGTKIIIFTSYNQVPFLGIEENSDKYFYLTKKASEKVIIDQIQKVMSTNSAVQHIHFKKDGFEFGDSKMNSLTDKELEVALLFAKGYGNLEICNELNLKKSTISTHKKKIFKKLHISNIKQLIDIIRNSNIRKDKVL